MVQATAPAGDWDVRAQMTSAAPLRDVLAAQLCGRFNDWPDRSDIASIWDCVHVDLQALSEMTGDAIPDVHSRLRQVQRMELIYADGTVARVMAGKLKEIKGM